MDLHSKAKEDVLQEIMDLMDSRMVDGLRAKSPKSMSVEIMAAKPEDKTDSEDPDSDLAEELKEALMDKPDMDDPMAKDQDQDEDLDRLREMYSRLK